MIYLDSAATANYSDVDDIIVKTITDAMKRYWQNPSSLYSDGQAVREKIEECRANVAKFINAKPEEIYFTSGASESNSWVIKGWSECNKENYIISTLMEHKSTWDCLDATYKIGNNIGMSYCDNDEYGTIVLNDLEECLCIGKPNPILVTICMANNEVATIQNIKRISDLVHSYNGVLHVDATQAFGHIHIDVEELGIDMMSASGHKISPVLKGVGFLYKRNGVDIKPLIYGAQENGIRGGTENTFGIIGLSKAIEWCDVSEDREFRMSTLRDYFIDKLETKFGCKLNGHPNLRLANNINVTFPQNITGESLLYMLDMSNIAMSTGSACNSKSIEPSHVLKAIGLTDEQAMRTVRFTLHDDIAYEDIDNIIEEIDKAIKILELERGDV